MEVNLDNQIRINEEEKIEREFVIKNRSSAPLFVQVEVNDLEKVETDLQSGELQPDEEERVKVRWDPKLLIELLPCVRVYFRKINSDIFTDFAELHLLTQRDFKLIKNHLHNLKLQWKKNDPNFPESERDVIMQTKGSHIKMFKKSINLGGTGGTTRDTDYTRSENLEISLGLESSISAIAHNLNDCTDSKIISGVSGLELENVGYAINTGRRTLGEVDTQGSVGVTIVREKQAGDFLVEMKEEKDTKKFKKKAKKVNKKFTKKKKVRNNKSMKKNTKKSKKSKSTRPLRQKGKLHQKSPREKSRKFKHIKSKHDRLHEAYKTDLVEEWTSRELSKMSKTLRNARTNQEIIGEREKIFKTYTRKSRSTIKNTKGPRKKKKEIIDRLYHKKNLRSLYAYAIHNQWNKLNKQFECFSCYKHEIQKCMGSIPSKSSGECPSCLDRLKTESKSEFQKEWITRATGLGPKTQATDLKISDYNLTITENAFPSEVSRREEHRSKPRKSAKVLVGKMHVSDQGHLRKSGRSKGNSPVSGKSRKVNIHKETLDKIREPSIMKHEQSTKRSFRSDNEVSRFRLLPGSSEEFFERDQTPRFDVFKIGTFGEQPSIGKAGFGKFDGNKFEPGSNGGNNFSFKSGH